MSDCDTWRIDVASAAAAEAAIERREEEERMNERIEGARAAIEKVCGGYAPPQLEVVDAPHYGSITFKGCGLLFKVEIDSSRSHRGHTQHYYNVYARSANLSPIRRFLRKPLEPGFSAVHGPETIVALLPKAKKASERQAGPGEPGWEGVRAPADN